MPPSLEWDSRSFSASSISHPANAAAAAVRQTAPSSVFGAELQPGEAGPRNGRHLTVESVTQSRGPL